MPWSFYLSIIAVMGLLFFATAVYALWWAIRSGHLRRLNRQSTMIFDDEEPEGRQSDFFPGKEDEGRRKLGEENQPPR